MNRELPGPLTVLLDTRRRHWNQNPYVGLLAQGLISDINVRGFSWRTAIFGKYDIVHVHWPEYLARGEGRIKATAQKIFFIIWLLRLNLFQTPVVKTVHNIDPHDGNGGFGEALLRLLERRYKARIWLTAPNAREMTSDPKSDVYIPHGDYVPWLNSLEIDEKVIENANAERRGSQITKLLCFGIIKKYKSLDQPISAVVGSSRQELRLVITGKASDRLYLDELIRLSDSDPRIELRGNRLSDSELIHEILQADFIVLPYRDLYNSGVLILALSLGRPVVLRRSAIAESIRDEYGSEWVYLYDDIFTQEVADALISSKGDRSLPRKLSPIRDWSELSKQHAQLYRRVMESVAGKTSVSLS